MRSILGLAALLMAAGAWAHPALRAAVGRAIVEGASSRLSPGEGARTGALLGS